jgi:PIN domain nuclease of toxin-antitoxin system
VKLLLDTHTVAWWAEGSDSLSDRARTLIDDAGHAIFISAVSAYEIALKHRLGKWPGADALLDAIEALLDADFTPLPVTIAHAARAGGYALTHRDPFDRLLAAQADIDGLVILSSDEKLDVFGVKRLW